MPRKIIENKQYKNIVIRICVIAALGGLLFGLNQGFVANSLGAIKSVYHMNLQRSEFFAAIIGTGAILGVFLSGFLARLIGRKYTLVLAGLVFVIMTIISMFLPSLGMIITCRFFIGFAVGLVSFVVPLYLSETAPSEIRGTMGTLFQFAIVIGILVIAISNVSIIRTFHISNITVPLMYGFLAIFSIIMLVGTLTLPETPRYLMLKGKEEKAKKVLKYLRDSEKQIEFEINEIKINLQTKTHGFAMFKKKYFWKVIALSVVLQVFQQLVGINLMIYYSPTIFRYAGMSSIVALLVVPVVNFIFTVPALKFIEKLGRKKLLIVGAIIMAVSMFSGAFAFLMIGHGQITAFEKTLLLVAVIIYIFGFAFSWGPAVWLLCSEIFPQEGREIGLTISTMVNWTFATVVVASSLTIMHKFGNASIFIIFGIFCVLAVMLVIYYVPETSGVELEQIEYNLKSGKKLKNIGRN